MAYRSDHEAALARLETLSLDNARLIHENEELRAELAVGDVLRPSMARQGILWFVAIAGMFVSGALVGAATMMRVLQGYR